MDLDQVMIIRQQKVIGELKAELTYWKETAEYWKDVAFEYERHIIKLNKLNKLNKKG